jgi:hypothetical protein
VITIYGLVSNRDPQIVRYFGQTSKPLKSRLYGHKWRASHGAQWHVSAWIRKEIAEGYSILIKSIKENLSEEEANSEEIRLIEKYRTVNRLVNIVDGGSGARGWVHSEEWKTQMSARMKVREFTDTHRKNISDAKIGVPRSEKDREKMKTRRHTDDTKKRLSAINKGKVLSEDTKIKMSRSQSQRKNVKDREDGSRECLSCREVKKITEFPREAKNGTVFYRRKCHKCRRFDKQNKK